MPQPTILAIETATSCCSVALTHQGQISERSLVGNNVHSQVVLEMVRELLESVSISVDELAAVAVGQGPGSFTGLRIGVGVAQGLAYGAGCPMIGISSLDALALQAPSDGVVLAGIDARMGEVYWAQYYKEHNSVVRQTALHVSPPELISTNSAAVAFGGSLMPVQLVGNAWREYALKLTADLRAITPIQAAEFPSATALMQLAIQAYERGATISAVDFAPEYVRNDVAKKPQPKTPKRAS